MCAVKPAAAWMVGLLIGISVLSAESSGLETAGTWVGSPADPIVSPMPVYSLEGASDSARALAVASALPAWRMLCRLTFGVMQEAVMVQPLELQLSIGTRTFLRGVRRAIRHFFRMLAWSVKQWASWMLEAAAFLLVAAAATLVDRDLVKTWRQQGFSALRVSITLALAVYVRLLIDRRAPMLGKGLLAFAIVYGVAGGDLLPDYLVPMGLIDDVIAVALASRCFMRLCPDRLVDAHAARAAEAWNRSLRRRAWRRPITTPLEQ